MYLQGYIENFLNFIENESITTKKKLLKIGYLLIVSCIIFPLILILSFASKNIISIVWFCVLFFIQLCIVATISSYLINIIFETTNESTFWSFFRKTYSKGNLFKIFKFITNAGFCLIVILCYLKVTDRIENFHYANFSKETIVRIDKIERCGSKTSSYCACFHFNHEGESYENCLTNKFYQVGDSISITFSAENPIIVKWTHENYY